MSERPPWVPDDVPDEWVDDYAGTIGGHLARLEWEAKRLGADGAHILADVDQARAHLREGAMRVLRREGLLP